jgi:membrane protein YdbS with pleckstrin-like domain
VAEYRKGFKVDPQTGLTAPEVSAGLAREEAEAQAADEASTARRPAPRPDPRAGLERNGRVNVKPSTICRVMLDVMTLGLYELWWRKTIYSVDDRKVTISRGIFSRSETEIPIEKVVGVNVQKSPMAGSSRVIIDTGAGATASASQLTRRDAAAFGAMIRANHEAAVVERDR